MTPKTMQKVRRYHLYLGMFFAPAIFLFALSGALQTFRLQEEKGWGSNPPSWIVWMASIHRDSRLPKAKPAEVGEQLQPQQKAPPETALPKAATPPATRKPVTLPMKIFAVLMSIGLMLSALLGVVIALNNRSLRRMSIAMLAAGTALPLVLLLF